MECLGKHLGEKGENIFSSIFPAFQPTADYDHYDFSSDHNVIELKTIWNNKRFTLRADQHNHLRTLSGFYAFQIITPERIDIYFVDPHRFNVGCMKTSIHLETVKRYSKVHLIYRREGVES